MSTKVKGTIYGVIAAVSYGTNPLGALFLYGEGINTHSVLFYRFFLAAIILGGMLVMQKKSLTVSLKELGFLAVMGVLFATSSLSLFTSFHHMDAGIASTILFVYPVMVAVIMAVFFKEKLSIVTSLSIVLALAGIALLYKGNGDEPLSTVGILLVMLSSLSYALYMIVINRSGLKMSALKMTFYVLIFCVLTVVVHSTMVENSQIQMLTTPSIWMWGMMMALVPTIISLITMAKAVRMIGTTPTAIMGALEPLTAVMIGVAIFGEILTSRLAIGILMILSAVVLIIAGKSINFKWLSLPKHYSGRKKRMRKHFR